MKLSYTLCHLWYSCHGGIFQSHLTISVESEGTKHLFLLKVFLFVSWGCEGQDKAGKNAPLVPVPVRKHVSFFVMFWLGNTGMSINDRLGRKCI